MKRFNIPPVYLLSCIIIIICSYFLFPGLDIIAFPFNLSGIVFFIPGLYLSGQAYELFSKSKTTVKFDESTSLVDTGIYRYSRNPMYLGMICLLTGIAICFGNLIGLLTPLAFFLIIQLIFIPFEEKKLRLSFGKSYTEYCRNVRRWI